MVNLPKPDGLTIKWWRNEITRIAPKTAQGRRSIIFQALRFLGREEQSEELRKVKLPKVQDSVTVEDLYTPEQLAAIFQQCQHPRDRAMMQVLYEGAFRAGELLSMKFENVQFEEDGTASVFVTGKTGTREVPLFASVPSLREWMNHHPIGTGAVWVRTRRPFTGIGWSALYTAVNAILKRANVKGKKKIVHMFRHSRITELVRLGIRGQTLHKLVGWTKKSNMEAVYVHLSTADIVNEVRTKVFGLEEDKERYEPVIRPQKCPRCGEANEPSARYCSKCNMPVSEDALVEELERKQGSEERIADLEKKVEQLAEPLNWLAGKD